MPRAGRALARRDRVDFMSDYAFRLRFNFATAYRINSDAEEIELLTLPTGESFRLRGLLPGKPMSESTGAAVLAWPWSSPEAARKAAEQTKRALLCWAVDQRVGIDFGDGRQQGLATSAGLAMWQEQLRCAVRNDIHGIDVYEFDPNIRFVSVGADATVGKSSAALLDSFRREFQNSRPLTDKQVLACEIYSGSFFDVSPRSRFITLVTAVEALLEPAPRSERVQVFVENIKEMVSELDADDRTKQSMISSLEYLKAESIGQCGRALADRLLPQQRYDNRSSSKFFKDCYDLRSDIVHRGSVRDSSIDLRSLANSMETFVSELLLASLRAG